MIHCIDVPVIYGDTRPDGGLRLDALANYLQTAAISHASRVGQDAGSLECAGATWVLHRLSARLEAQPVSGDRLEVRTWATDFGAIRAGREFEVRRDGVRVACAASTWVYFDLVEGGLRRITPDVAASYQPEPAGTGFVASAHSRVLRGCPAGEAARTVVVSLRPSDFDGNGHVNNAAYLDLALTGLAAHSAGGGWVPEAFVIEFRREIRGEVESVEVAVVVAGAEAHFAITAGGVERARGWIRGAAVSRLPAESCA